MSNPFYKNQSPFKISEIFESLNIKFSNENLDKEILDIKDLLNAKDSEITFFHSKKYSDIAKKTKASFCITTNSLKQYLPESCIPIIVENVLVATSKVTSKFYPSAVNDYFEDDPTVTALLKTNSGMPVHLVAAHASEYALFELEIIGSKKTIRMRDGGLNWSNRRIIENPRYSGYKNLSNDQYVEGSYHEAMANAVENIYKAIIQGDKILCTGHEACEAHKICQELLKKTDYRKDIR